MYLIVKKDPNETTYWGPFPTERRAEQYAESFEDDWKFEILPLIVPNACVIKYNY